MSESTLSYARELNVAKQAARVAGATIMEFYNTQSAESYVKTDGSVVTDADLASDRIIRHAILEAFPEDALLTEEGVDAEERLSNPRVWIVDPIDGTNQFVDRTGEFDVLIALIVDGRPVASVMYQPTEDLLLSAVYGYGATIEQHQNSQPLRLTPVPQEQAPRLLTSVWLGDPENRAFFEQVAIRMAAPPPVISSTGVSLRRIMPGNQTADVLVGYKPGRKLDDQTFAWEWDFAAPDLIVNEAGGSMTDVQGHRHRYNKRIPRNEHGIIIAVDPVTNARVADAIALERAVE